jgi:hypothetical protein
LTYVGGVLDGKYLYSADGKSIGEDPGEAFSFMWYPEDLADELAMAIGRIGWDLRAARAR